MLADADPQNILEPRTDGRSLVVLFVLYIAQIVARNMNMNAEQPRNVLISKTTRTDYHVANPYHSQPDV